ncbi:MAG: hypothetical protein LBH65_03380, partial [Desulfovibrio sp.]|nr:hypothetical protein [Desulfovibrio sp.]
MPEMAHNIAEELEKVVKLVKEKAGSHNGSTDSMALVRIINSITPDEWERFASTYGLESWICFPLQETLANSV